MVVEHVVEFSKKFDRHQTFIGVCKYYVWLLQAAVDDLYAFRDHYFENHSIEQAPQKLSDVEKELEKAMVVLDGIAGIPSILSTG